MSGHGAYAFKVNVTDDFCDGPAFLVGLLFSVVVQVGDAINSDVDYGCAVTYHLAFY